MSSTNIQNNWETAAAGPAATVVKEEAQDAPVMQASTKPAEKKSVIDARKRVAEAQAAVEAAQIKATAARTKADEAEAKALDLEYQVADTEALAAEARLKGAKEKEAKQLRKDAEAKRKKATDLQAKATAAGVQVKPAEERKRVVESKEAEKKRKTADAEEAAAVKVEKILADAQSELTSAESALEAAETRAKEEAKAKEEEEARKAAQKAEAEAAAAAAAEAERQRIAALPPPPALTEEEVKAFEAKYMKKAGPAVDEAAPVAESRPVVEEAAPPPPTQPYTMPDIILSSVYSQFYDSEPSVASLDPSDRKVQQRIVSFVDIPAGTVLFRGERLPDEGEDLRNFYRDFLGSIGADGRFCMPPTYNVFFYPFPYVAFGAEDYGERFNALQMYVTRKKITLACMIGPSNNVRGTPIGYDSYMPIMRCNKVYDMDPEEFEPILCGSTGDRKDKKLDAMSYDNCLNPYYMDALNNPRSRELPIHGWMAIAEKDSFDIFEGKGRNKRTVKKGKNTPMGTYLKQLEKRFPGKVSEVLSWMYTDHAGHRGFPEISLYPMTPHPGSKTQYIDAPTMDSALNFIENNSDKFVYLPLACFTASQTLDGLESEYAVTDIPTKNRKRFPREEERKANANAMRLEVRQGIERQVDAYMSRFMTEGIEIPGIGLSKIVFDPRTGFYVVDSFIRKKNPLIQDITKQYEGGMNPYFPYLSILMPLDTPEDRKIAMDYCIIYNKFNPQKLFNPELLYQEGPVVYRSFIFNRPANYQGLFTNLNSRFPLNLKLATNRATFKFKRNIINRGETLQKGFTAKDLEKAPQTKTRGQRGGRHMRTRKQRRSMVESIANENLGIVQETLLTNQ